VIARTTLGRGLALGLSLALSQVAVPAAQAATTHLVEPGQAVERLIEGAASREAKVQLFQSALGTPEARRQARSMGLNADRLRAAVPHLTDAELKDLGSRAANAKDLVAGHRGGNGGLVILGLVLLLAGLAVLVAVGDYGEDYYYDDCYCY